MDTPITSKDVSWPDEWPLAAIREIEQRDDEIERLTAELANWQDRFARVRLELADARFERDRLRDALLFLGKAFELEDDQTDSGFTYREALAGSPADSSSPTVRQAGTATLSAERVEPAGDGRQHHETGACHEPWCRSRHTPACNCGGKADQPVPALTFEPCSSGGLFVCKECDVSYASPPWDGAKAAADHAHGTFNHHERMMDRVHQETGGER